MPAPSLMATILSIGTSFSLSIWPLGHVISSRSILAALAKAENDAWIAGGHVAHAAFGLFDVGPVAGSDFE